MYNKDKCIEVPPGVLYNKDKCIEVPPGDIYNKDKCIEVPPGEINKLIQAPSLTRACWYTAHTEWGEGRGYYMYVKGGSRYSLRKRGGWGIICRLSA